MKIKDKTSISELVAELFSTDNGVVEEAQFGLQKLFGSQALPAVLKVFPNLGYFGQRCAIEFIQNCDLEDIKKIKNPTVIEKLIPFLKNEDEVVRFFTAETLGWMGDPIAAKPLLDAYETSKKNKIPIDWSEPSKIRWALRKTGIFERIFPKRLLKFVKKAESLQECFPVEYLVEVIDILSRENQVVLYFQVWEKGKKPDGEVGLFRVDCPKFEVDLYGLWKEVVEKNRIHALKAAWKTKRSKNYLFTIEWISEKDR